MTKEVSESLDRWLKYAQFCVALTALIAALTYAGKRSERDEQQTRALDRISVDLSDIRKDAQEGIAQVRVLGERVRGLEDRVGRVERRP